MSRSTKMDVLRFRDYSKTYTIGSIYQTNTYCHVYLRLTGTREYGWKKGLLLSRYRIEVLIDTPFFYFVKIPVYYWEGRRQGGE